MTAVPPSAPVPQGSPLPPQTLVAVVSDPPPALLALPLGSRLAGLVLSGAATGTPTGAVTGAATGAAAGGTARIVTDAGTLDLQTPVPLAKGTALALVLEALTPRVRVRIAAAGAPSPDAATAPGRSAPPSAAPATAPDRSLPAIAVGTRLTATLVRPAPWISATAAQPTTAQPTTFGPPTTLPAGSRLTVGIVAVQPTTVVPPAAEAASFEPTALAAGRTLRGTVIGATPAGQPLLRTAAGVLTLATAAAALPRGTALTVEIAGTPPLPPAPAADIPPAVAGAPLLDTSRLAAPLLAEDVLGSTGWPALTEAVEALAAADPAAARHLISALLPRPDAGLATTVLFFLSALRGGDVRGWLGDAAVRTLNRTRPDLSTRLGDDFRKLGRAAEEAVPNDWRITQVPLFTGAEVELIRLWTRRHDDPSDDDDDNRRSQDQRFVVDVSLSRLGRLQLDGLVRDAGRRLDLIVRTESPLAPAMRDHIRGLFGNAGALTGLTGGVGFQAAPPNFVDVAAEPPAGHHPGVLV
jgi:hypothetical protein